MSPFHGIKNHSNWTLIGYFVPTYTRFIGHQLVTSSLHIPDFVHLIS